MLGCSPFDESLKFGWMSFKVFQKSKYYFGKIINRTDIPSLFSAGAKSVWRAKEAIVR